MQNIKDRVQEIVAMYEYQLAERGIRIAVYKRNCETEVTERSGGVNMGQAIFNSIDRARDRKQEKENGYNYAKNKYHCLVLSILPIDKKLVREKFCKDYAFILRKTERAHIGLEPRHAVTKEDKVVARVEKRILKVLKRAEKEPVQKVCKDTLFDALRYSTTPKYGYKKEVLGKDLMSWDLMFSIAAGAFVIAIVLLAWFVSSLF